MKSFFKNAPLFIYSIFFLLGIAFVFSMHPIFLITCLICLWFFKKPLMIGVLLLGCIWAWFSYTLPVLNEDGLEVEGTYRIDSISYSHSPFQRSILFKGLFSSHEKHLKKIPCSIYFKETKPRPSGSKDLFIQGKLVPKEKHRYVLKPSVWDEIPSTYSFAGFRFGLKNKIRDHLTYNFHQTKNRAFLLSMITGEIDDRLLSLEFNRLGILHLLGISGFQFALLALLLGSLFRVIFSYQISNILLLLSLSAYTFLLGDSPPIERAWLGISLYLIALLLGHRISPLNALGAALVVQLVKDPLIIFHLGFQFSFLCTFAILVIYPLIRPIFLRLFPTRTFQETLQMDLVDQHGYLFCCFWRETLAINFAIHLLTLPMILFHFHKFSLLSLIYNLFLPAGVSIIYAILIIGLFIYPAFPYLSCGIYKVVDAVTDFILKIATHPPALYDFQWRVKSFPLSLAVILGIGMILISMHRSKEISSTLR